MTELLGTVKVPISRGKRAPRVFLLFSHSGECQLTTREIRTLDDLRFRTHRSERFKLSFFMRMET